MITAYQKEFLSGSVSFWTTSVNNNNIPDIVRCTGLRIESENSLRCFFANLNSTVFRQNLDLNGKIAVFGTNIISFTGYQYKGMATAIAKCSDEGIEFQRNYLKEFCDAARAYGLDSEKLFSLYYRQPSFSVTVRIEHIFEQTPKQNTGGEVR